MDLTTEAIKELKHAYDDLPSLPGTHRVAAAEVLALLQSLSPGVHALSADRVLALIRRVTAEAAGAPPATGKAAVVVNLPDEAPGTQADAPAPWTAASLQGTTSPTGACPPTAPLPQSPLEGDLPTDVVAPYCLPKSKAAAAAAAAATAGGVAGARAPGPPAGAETRRAAGEDRGRGDESSSSSDDSEGTAAAAAAAAAVRDNFMRPGAVGGHRGPSVRTGVSEWGSMDAHVKGVKHEGSGKGHHHHHHSHQIHQHHHHHHHHGRHHRPHGDAVGKTFDRAPTTVTDGTAPKPPPSSTASLPPSAAPPRPAGVKSLGGPPPRGRWYSPRLGGEPPAPETAKAHRG
eukprot:TRINITY_DN6896_c0_g1_i1.p1 TRINITY_DN6896_c0_g1~~TRINITY_DN6896_c0_g1_i1.p1  ORF type:complete len:345 (-),score=59.63 TRINITY_DN6896_c0_g1_i1:3-1037(-)